MILSWTRLLSTRRCLAVCCRMWAGPALLPWHPLAKRCVEGHTACCPPAPPPARWPMQTLMSRALRQISISGGSMATARAAAARLFRPKNADSAQQDLAAGQCPAAGDADCAAAPAETAAAAAAPAANGEAEAASAEPGPGLSPGAAAAAAAGAESHAACPAREVSSAGIKADGSMEEECDANGALAAHPVAPPAAEKISARHILWASLAIGLFVAGMTLAAIGTQTFYANSLASYLTVGGAGPVPCDGRPARCALPGSTPCPGGAPMLHFLRPPAQQQLAPLEA